MLLPFFFLSFLSSPHNNTNNVDAISCRFAKVFGVGLFHNSLRHSFIRDLTDLKNLSYPFISLLSVL